MQLPFPFTRNTTPSSRSTTLTPTNVQRRAHTSASILLYDDVVVEDCDYTVPHGPDGRSLPQEIEPLRHAAVPQGQHRVVSTVNPGDKTVTQLLHHKPISDERMANSALSEMDLIHLAPLILQGLYTALLTKREDVIYTSSKQSPLSRGSPSCVLPTPTPPASTFYRWTCSSTPSPDDADEGRKGHYFCYPSMSSLTSSSATNRCSHPTTSS